jgi:hypothetical protein
MKECFKCKVELPLDQFYKHPKMKDGHVNKCIECNKADVRGSYRRRPVEERKAYERGRLHAEHRIHARLVHYKNAMETNPQSIRDAKSKWYYANRRKKRAETAVARAIRQGRLVRLPCERCSSPRSQGHHEDYSKPLDVMWLCAKHHGERHRELRDMGITL